MSTSAPTVVLKDSKGYVWIGSQNGLNRFDGTGFKWFNHDIKDTNSISDDYVMCLCEDPEGNLWIGTMSNGLNRYNRKSGTFEKFLYDSKDENSISSNNIRALFYDDNKLWIGTQQGGISILDLKTKKFTKIRHNPNNPHSLSNDFIWTMLRDREGFIWIGTNGNGLDKYSKSTNTFEHYVNNPADNQSISHNEIRTLYEDREGNIWAGTNGQGVSVLNKKTGKFKRIISNPGKKLEIQNNVVLGIAEDENGYFWIGEYLNGLNIYNPVTEQFIEYQKKPGENASLLFNSVYSVYKDSSGVIWVTTEGKGVFVYDNKKWKFKHFNSSPNDPNSLTENLLWRLEEDNTGNIWVASKNGLSVFNPKTRQCKNYFASPDNKNTISDNSVNFPYKDSQGYMWISTQVGALDRVNLKTLEWEHFYSHPDDTSKKLVNIICMIEDKDGQLWMGTYADGLKMFNKERTKVTCYTHNDNDANSISSNSIWDLNIDNEGNIMIGSYSNGFDIFDSRAQKFTNYCNNPKDSNSISLNIISYTHQDKEGIYWIATYGGGLNRFDRKNNIFKRYTVENGLSDNSIYGILVDKSGRFWLSTNQGLSRFDPKTDIFVNYNTGDGLQAQEFNQNSFLESSTGEFYFGGINGFNYFNPMDFSESKIIPPAVFTSFKIYGKEAKLPVSIDETDEIVLNHKENFFTIEYAVLEYTNPAKIKYSYMLEGIDEKWNEVNNIREAHYTNIGSGNYTFRLKYTNSDGVWNKEGKSVKITITPPWWKNWWFRGLATILVIGLIFYGINKRIRIIKKEKELQQEFTQKLINSHEEERKKLSAELHDSLGQDLVIIKNSANMALKNQDPNSDTSKFIKQITEISSSALQNVRVISHNLRPAELDKLGLTETIKSIIDKVSSASEIVFESDVDIIDNVFEKNNEVGYCRIIQECLNNIMKHSKATRATIQIKSTEDRIITIIKDNGVGFNYDETKMDSSKSTFGITGLIERVKMLNGTIKINSSKEKGTEIVITNPVIQKKI
jgi:signal transduction histidine kinase/ligand-binding sensor domain-containing protein